MERLEPLSKCIIRNDSTVDQPKFFDYTNTLLNHLISLKVKASHKGNRNMKLIIKHIKKLYSVVTQYPQTVLLISSDLLQISDLLMLPSNDDSLRELSWKSIIGCINSAITLNLFETFLSKIFIETKHEYRVDVGEIGKITADVLYKQFLVLVNKFSKSTDFEKMKLHLRIIKNCIPITFLKNFTIYNQKIIYQIIDEVSKLEKKFNTTIFDGTIRENTALYLSQLCLLFKVDEQNAIIIYKFVKYTFPCKIESKDSIDLTKHYDMVNYLNHQKLNRTEALSYFNFLPNNLVLKSFVLLFQNSRNTAKTIFINFLDIIMQTIPIYIVQLQNPDLNAILTTRFFSHVIRLNNLINILTKLNEEIMNYLIGSFFSTMICNLPYNSYPFMILFFFSYLVDRRTINESEETKFAENIVNLLPSNCEATIAQIVSTFGAQMAVGLFPILFKIQDRTIRNEISYNPVAFQREKTINPILENFQSLLKTKLRSSSNSSFTSTNSSSLPKSISSSAIPKPIASATLPKSIPSSQSLDKLFSPIYFYFSINFDSFKEEEASKFIFDFIHCFSPLSMDTLIPSIIYSIGSLIQYTSQKTYLTHDFLMGKLLPYSFKLLTEKSNQNSKENLFNSVKRIIGIIRKENLFTVQISKLWCISLMFNIQNEQPSVVKAAISSCLQGIPYAFALFPMIFNCLFDSTIRDQKTIEFLACAAIVSPEFSQYSLHELELTSVLTKNNFETMMCMSILLLLHSIKESSVSKEQESQTSASQKEIYLKIFLDSLGKIHLSPYLMSSLLLILPSFFDELNSQFNLIFDIILGGVKDLLYKLMVFPDFYNSSLLNASSPSTDTIVNPEQTPAQLLSSNTTYNQSIAFISKMASDSILYIIQSFKNLIMFCVKLFWASLKNEIIQRTTIEIILFCRKINSQNLSKATFNPNFNFFYIELDKIIERAISSCFCYPRTSRIMKNHFEQDIDNDSSLFLSFHDKTIYAFKNFDDENARIYSSLPYGSTIYNTKKINVKFEDDTLTESPHLKSSENDSNAIQEPQKEILTDSITPTNSIVDESIPVSGISLFMDVLTESINEPIIFDDSKSKSKFISQFKSNFKSQFHIRLIYFSNQSPDGQQNLTYSHKFTGFLKSLGVQQSEDKILASDYLYEAAFEFSPNLKQIVAVAWVDDNAIFDLAIHKLQNETQLPVFIIVNPSKNGLYHTKVIFKNFGFNQPENSHHCSYCYDIPNGEHQNKDSLPAYSSFGPLIGSLFLPSTLLSRLVRETAVNGSVYVENQKQILENIESNKKKKSPIFIPWGSGHFFL